MLSFLAANPMAIQAIGTGIKIFGAFGEASRARRQAAFQEQQLRIQMEQNKLATLERTNDRNRELLANEKINRAYTFSKLGRDPSDRSFRAFMAKNRETAGQDTDRLQRQHLQTMGKLRGEITTVRMAAKNAQMGAMLGVASAAATGLFRYYDYKTDETGFKFNE